MGIMVAKALTFFCFLMTLSVGYSCTTDDDLLIDIIFVVDGSGSIGKDNFDLVKAWLVNATASMMHKFGSRAQLGVLQYSSKDPAYRNIPLEQSNVFVIPFRLGECTDVECMKPAILGMPYLGAQTYTYYALRRVIDVEFPISPHYPNSRKAIILLTDGAANDGLYLEEAYDKTVVEQITNFAIGVGNFQIQQLKIFANGGSTNERVFTRTDFESLSTVINTLQKELEKEGFFCDECAVGTDNCSPNAKCINNDHGFDCECRPGYHGDGVECADINECYGNPCPKNSVCIDGINNYQCNCNKGYEMVGDSCRNTDDCLSNPCSGLYPKCVDKIGGYVCEREQGDDADTPNGGEDLNTIIAILCFILAAIIIVLIAGIVVCILRRQHVYTLRETGKSSREDYLMEQQKYEETAAI